MTLVSLHPDFDKLIDPTAQLKRVGTGFTFTEGPVWHPLNQYLLFSDMPADVRRRWDTERGVVEVRRPANKCNGMTYDFRLNLIVCEDATSMLVRERPDGHRETHEAEGPLAQMSRSLAQLHVHFKRRMALQRNFRGSLIESSDRP
jgi:gluconolactonase